MIWFGPAPVEGSFEFQSSTASPGGYLMAIVSPTGNVAYKSNPTTGQGGTFSVDESDFEEVGTYALWACINNGGVCGVVSNTVHVTVSLTED